jgi:hypothetical protein
MTMLYDIIGDIHGHSDALVALLKKMDYKKKLAGVWSHPTRQAIFVGDFVDLGPKQVEAVMIAKHMVESGSALAVLGNHDLNAIAWYLPDPMNDKEYLRPHFSEEWGEKNRKQHAAFLAEVDGKAELQTEIIDWFLTLPLWLNLPGIRVVHACWHSRSIEYLTPILLPGARLSKELMPAAAQEPKIGIQNNLQSPASVFAAVEALTKGIEVSLPTGNCFRDKYGIVRTRVRVRWWNEQATTYQSAAFLDDALKKEVSTEPLPENTSVFEGTGKPIFIGHYWLTGTPSPLTDKVACVDYSVGHGGPLCAYRWEGETVLNSKQFVCVGGFAP